MLNHICQLARNAGNVVMESYSGETLVKESYKSDKTPVTHVDIQSSNIIKKGLLLISPEIPIISEEDFPDIEFCRHWDQYWLIDPLDGTKEFLKKNGEFTINISLIKNGIPILGVIYAPFFDVLYSSFEEEAWKESKNSCKKIIHVSQAKIPSLISSRSHIDKELNNYLNKIKYHRIKNIGSSLKFCLIAEGKFQIYPRFGNTHIWDTAAGHAILIAAGGAIRTWSGEDLNYSLSNRSSFINPGFCASSI